MENEIVRLHATIKGRVQGVGFRAFVHHQAVELRLTGWVRNRWDGSVEVIAEGPRPALDRFLAILRRGPGYGFVSQVEPEWGTATGEFDRFNVRGTA